MIPSVKEVADTHVTFGGNMKELLPASNDIPEEFYRGNTKWNVFVKDWFYQGIKALNVLPKDGIDVSKAIRHIQAILVSYEPEHNHKIAGCAYLASVFFESVQYELIKE